jgi:hypothetical protein
MNPSFPLPTFQKILFVLFISAGMSACTFDDSGMPPVEPFSKKEQERIGNRIHFAVLAASGYDLVPQVPPFDSTLFDLTSEWYTQLTAGIQKDISSPSSDRWDKDRPWIVTLLDHPDEIAVAAPGGYLYLSTGLLSALDRESQLYFVMALEAAAVRQQVAMNRLIAQFGTDPLRRIARGVQGAGVPSANALTDWLFSQAYSPSEIEELDASAAEIVCESSLFSPSDLSRVLDLLDENKWWKIHRSFPGRGADWKEREFQSCGTISTVGLYTQKIQPYLP